MTHPALHDPAASSHVGDAAPEADQHHFVPNGWEPVDAGICPCGEAVRWDAAAGRWIPDRSLVVLVLTADQARHLRDDALMVEDLEPVLDLQLWLNTEPEHDHDDAGIGSDPERCRLCRQIFDADQADLAERAGVPA